MEDVVKNHGAFHLGFLLMAGFALANQLQAQSPLDGSGTGPTVWGTTFGTMSTYSGGDVLPSGGGGGVPTNDAEATGMGDMGGGGGGATDAAAIGRWEFSRPFSAQWYQVNDERLAKTAEWVNYSYSETMTVGLGLEGTVQSSVQAQITIAQVVSAGIGFQASTTIKSSSNVTVKPRYKGKMELYGIMFEKLFYERYTIAAVPVPGTEKTGWARQAMGDKYYYADSPI